MSFENYKVCFFSCSENNNTLHKFTLLTTTYELDAISNNLRNK